ncbi:RND family efflux transporter MFP subunit [Gloeomargarita lithophora Alchichica-D10]|uniref:RND family efflux transporter MFP subunit n=1 Tax=Gloeomargarita lithophora Alchichica-D10 TaxID=1188229 RepID=A0A1J0AEN1_9CYAN|nr:efflux RND transporter periplasmic adaptor subunit [Gloeomargarita lithophora]APB34381.1 RND family efflux transporter MFP subunit [Gloeomargarita lithophora Alchichica-D10]
MYFFDKLGNGLRTIGLGFNFFSTGFALTFAMGVLAHVGHGNEFQNDQKTQSSKTINVDGNMAKRLGLKTEVVQRQLLAFGVKITGQIETLPNQQVEVTTPVGGTVVRLLVKPGDTVQAGQAVAMMTSPELAELRTTAFDRQAEAIASVQQAQADLQLAQQNLTQQKRIVATDIQQAQTELNFAQERYEKDQELLEQGAIPRRQFLESESNLARIKASLAKAESSLPISEAKAQLQRAKSAVEVAQSRVSLSDKTYKTRLQQLGARPNADGTLTVTAPISGVVADQETTQGESGQDAGKKIMTIVNGRSVQVSGNIFEKDLGRISIGQRVRVRANGMPDRVFNGAINVVGAVVNGETRVIPVKAELDNSGGFLRPGMFVDLEVLTDRTPAAVLAIPKSAIVETNNNQRVVFVQNGHAFEPTEVILGRESGNFVEVTSGLFDGDWVVTQRANQLYAQSLRGGTTATADAHSEPATASTTNAAVLPWWVVIAAGGAIAAGTFFAGIYLGRRKYLQLAINPTLNGNGSSDYESEIYLSHTSQSEPVHSSKSPEG